MGVLTCKLNVSRVVLLAAVITLTACGGGGSSSKKTTPTTTTTGDVTETDSGSVVLTKLSISGNVSNGLAYPDASVDVVWADGEESGAAQTDGQGDYDLELPDGITYPFIVRVAKSDGTYLETVVTGEGKDNANLNPITTIVSQLVVGDKASGDGSEPRDFSGITDEVFEQTGDAITAALFGEGVEFETFDHEPFLARTEDNPDGGGLADTLIDVIGGLDPSQPVEDILTKALDPNDSTFKGDLLEDPGFQTRLAGELIGQGRSAEDALDYLSAGTAPDAEDGTRPESSSDLVARAGEFLQAFETVRTDAEGQGLSPEMVEKLIQSSAAMTSDMVDRSEFEGNDDLAAMVSNIVQMAGPALVDVAGNPENRDLVDGGEFEHMLRAMADEVGGAFEDVGGDLTRVLPPEEFAVLKEQMGHFAEVMGGPMADGLRDPAMDNLSPEEVAVLMGTMGQQMGDTVGGFINELGEGAIPPELLAAADNFGGPMFDAMMVVMGDENLGHLEPGDMREMLGVVGDVSAEQLDRLDLRQENFQLGDVEHLLANLAGAVGGMAVDPNLLGEGGVEGEAGSHVLGATVAQAMDTLLQLESQGKFDLHSLGLPPEALLAAENIGQLIGPALAGSVADGSNRTGHDLEMLLNSAAAGAMQELLGAAPDLTTEFDHTGFEEDMRRHAAESAISLEQSFQQIEAAGIPLGDITAQFERSGLDSNAIGMVATQMAAAFGPGAGTGGEFTQPEDLLNSAHIFAEMASESANNALRLGGSIDDARELVAMTTTTLMEVGEHGGFQDIRESAHAMQEGMDFAAKGENFSMEEMQAFAQDMGIVIAGTVEQHFAGVPLDENGNPMPPPADGEFFDPNMPPPGEHVNFDDLIGAFQQPVNCQGTECGPLSFDDMAAFAPIDDFQQFDQLREDMIKAAGDQFDSSNQLTGEFDQLAAAAFVDGVPEGDFQDVFDQFNKEQEHFELPEGVDFEEFVANNDGFMPPPECFDAASCGGMPPEGEPFFPEDGTMPEGGTFVDENGNEVHPPEGEPFFPEDGTIADGGTFVDEFGNEMTPPDGEPFFPEDGTFVDENGNPLPPPDGSNPEFPNDGTLADGSGAGGDLGDGTFIDDGVVFEDPNMTPPEGDPAGTVPTGDPCILPDGSFNPNCNTSVDPVAGDPAAGDPGAVDPVAGDPGTVDPGTVDPGTVDPVAGDPAAGDPGTVGPVAGDPAAGDPGTVGPVAGDPAAGDPGTIGPIAGDPIINDPIVTQPIINDPIVTQPVVNDPPPLPPLDPVG